MSYKRLMLLQILSRVNVAEVVVVEACQPKAMLAANTVEAEEGATRRVNNRFIKQGEQHQSFRKRKHIAFFPVHARHAYFCAHLHVMSLRLST